MPIQHYGIDQENKSDERLIGYSIDVETAPSYEPDIPGLCQWVQHIALGIIDDGWTHNLLLEEAVNIRIVNPHQIVLVDTITNRTPLSAN